MPRELHHGYICGGVYVCMCVCVCIYIYIYIYIYVYIPYKIIYIPYIKIFLKMDDLMVLEISEKCRRFL